MMPLRPGTERLPLAVDLDGTLVKTDLLIESAVALVKRRLVFLFLLPLWLLRGRSVLKHEIARRVDLNASLLPYRRPFLEWLTEEKAAGRTLVLATASDERLARAVADHLGIFDSVLGSTKDNNLKGSRKRDALVKKFGAKGFAYAGDAAADVPIWSEAGEIIVVGAASGVAAAAARAGSVSRTFPSEGGRLRSFIKAIRVKQWVKNILVFIPVLTAHRLSDVDLDLRAAVGFAGCCLCASAVYLANDLMDLEADRRHRSKNKRPFASGTLPLTAGLVAAPLFLVAAFALATWLDGWWPIGPRLPRLSGSAWPFTAVLGIYFVITNFYTFALKREALLDVLCLAALYTLRIFAGAAATNVPVSMWLIALSMFAFLSLALVKRVSELRLVKDTSEQTLHGRGYSVADLPVLSQAGLASGFMAVMVFALYIHSDEVKPLYTSPQTLWFICPLILYWIMRVWLLTYRGMMHDDPVEFAVKDRASYLVALLGLVIMTLARW